MTNKTHSGFYFTELLKDPSQLEKQDPAIGLVSMDDLISNVIGIHPYAVSETAKLSEQQQQVVLERAGEFETPAEWYVTVLTNILVKAAKIAGDKPLRVRLSGADSHCRQALVGSELEATEVNPLIGLRGVSRFADKTHRKSFDLECEVIKRARNSEGMANIELVIPFVRTYSEAATAIDLLAERGLCRGAQGLKVHLMCELPANALLTEKFLPYFDGLVIDIDQLGQFALGLDQNHESLNYLHDDQNEAVLQLVRHAVNTAESAGKVCEVVSHYIHKAPKLQKWLLDHDVRSVISQ
ncbi:putative PEP-binding protein [Photobacterium chitinilyticum]|uniref:Phosphoenolpyruvate-utilizing protein n=1 Tax=Photobacterium chitinilyticum TaxID=2485123 RepID=A0A3S4TPM5_9GAMM|nr:putative PEP-binding protein [Photobacterium chitinilyticum]RWX57156.1 phosphoenolpyruvate-utilizing protein [Photobacterium chitinilyticum]